MAREHMETLDAQASFIKDYSRWPCWPRLPVKRYKQGDPWPELGVVCSSNTRKVYLMDLWGDIDPDTPVLTYYDVEGMLADGWRVD